MVEEMSKETTIEEVIEKMRETLKVQSSPIKALSTYPERGKRDNLDALNRCRRGAKTHRHTWQKKYADP